MHTIQIDIDHDDLKTISPGALKLLIAIEISPGATNAKLSCLTGYKIRQVQNLKRELERYRLLGCSVPIDELTIEQMIARSALIRFGLDSGTAKTLAVKYTAKQIDAAIEHARKSPGIANPIGFLIFILRTNPDVPAIQTRDEQYRALYNA